MLFLFAIVLGVVFGLLVGGHLSNLARLRFRWPWFVAAAVIVREAMVLTPLSRVAGAQYIYALALAAIGAWTVFHWNRMRGMSFVTAGIALNLVVILVNGAHMPVARELAGSALLRRGTIGQYTVMGDATSLNLLGDWIRMWPIPEAYSPGDVLVAIGLAVVLLIATATPARIVS